MKKEKRELPPQNERIRSLVNRFAAGNVSSFVEKLNGISHQTLNRIFNIDTRTNNYPGVSADIISSIVSSYNVNSNWILTGEGEMILESKTNHSLAKESNDPSAFEILSILTKTIDRHERNSEKNISVYEKFAETIKLQVDILAIIGNSMARQDSQAMIADKVKNIELSLADTRLILDKISDTQNRSVDKSLDDLAEIKQDITSLLATRKRKQ